MSIYEDKMMQLKDWLDTHSPSSAWEELAQQIEPLTKLSDISNAICAWCAAQGIALNAGGAAGNKSILNTPYPDNAPTAAVPSKQDLLNALRRSTPPATPAQEPSNAVKKS